MNTFVFIDTNLYVRFTSQGMPGCEQVHWDKLVARVKDGSITLLVPEVVKLELERQGPAIMNGVRKKLGDAREQLRQLLERIIDDTEAKEVPAAVLKSYEELTDAKLAEMARRSERVLQMFAMPEVKHIEFTPEIFFRAKKRQIAGRIGQHEDSKRQRNQEKDCCIIESLAHHFKSDVKDAQLLFCSENHTELAINPTPMAKRGEEKWALHPLLADSLPTSQYFLDLSKMIAFVEQNQPVVPPEPEAIKAAVEREEEEAILGRGARPDAEALLAAIIGIRSLIQQRLGRTSRIGTLTLEKLYDLMVEFEEAASFLFVEELWECLRALYDGVKVISSNVRIQKDPVARRKLENNCGRFVRLSAAWIEEYRATDGFAAM